MNSIPVMTDGSAYRPLPLKIRPDLQISEQVYRGDTYWIVGDVVAMEYYRFNAQEFALLSWFDGKNSIDDIQSLFEAKFAPHRIHHREIQSFMIDVYKKSLLISSLPGQGRHLHQIGSQKQTKKKLKEMGNVLAFRWKSVNPDRFLDFICPLTSWFFSKPMIAVCLALMFSALALVVVNFEKFLTRLPSVNEFFGAQNLLIVVGVVIVTKIFHELAHGIVMKKFGGTCHQLGILFLVFLPTMFVNTSDSWRFRDKWKRAAVGAAGIYIELVLAAVATLLWWNIVPGILEYILLNVMLICTITTVMFNGNPFLRFDGYFVLSDILEIPNLIERSNKMVRNWFLTGGLGVAETDEHGTPWETKAWMAFYVFGSYLYKIFIVYLIAFWVHRLFRPVGLESFATMFSILLMIGLTSLPLIALTKYFWIPGRKERIKPVPALVTSLVLLGLGLLVTVVPFPEYVNCKFTIQPQNFKTIYANHDAILEKIDVKPGESVVKGQIIGKLRNIDLDIQIAEIEGQLEEWKSELANISRIRFDIEDASSSRARLEQQIITQQKKLDELLALKESLVLVSPTQGAVVPEWINRQPDDRPEKLARWSGDVLLEESLRIKFKRGDVICRIGDATTLTAKLVIDQFDMRWVNQGQSVELMLDSSTTRVIESELKSFAIKDSAGLPPEHAITHGGTVESKSPELAKYSADDKTIEIARPIYEGSVPIPGEFDNVSPGQLGHARIFVGHCSLVSKLTRFLYRTFRFNV